MTRFVCLLLIAHMKQPGLDLCCFLDIYNFLGLALTLQRYDLTPNDDAEQTFR